MMDDTEKVTKRLEWILENDRFGFGVNLETGEPRDDYEIAGKIITDTITLLKEQKAELLQQEAELDALRNIYKQENPYKQMVKWE